jgi:hypothetical protein
MARVASVQTENEESFFDVSDDALERLADGMSTCTNHGGCVSDVRLPFMYVPFPFRPEPLAYDFGYRGRLSWRPLSLQAGVTRIERNEIRMIRERLPASELP